jgi:hypothetical protein
MWSIRSDEGDRASISVCVREREIKTKGSPTDLYMRLEN